MKDLEDISGILVTFHVDEEQYLFIALFDDGTLNRMGTGSLDILEKDLFIGRAPLSVFERLKRLVTPKMLKWFDSQHADPSPKGKICKLVIDVKRKDGKEMMSVWLYGSESVGPPAEISSFALEAIEITNPWYEEQKKKAGGQSSTHSG